LFTVILPAFLSAEETFKWQKISGAWQIKSERNSGYLFDQYSRSVDYGYSDLINNNSLISIDAPSGITRISSKIELLSPRAEDNHITVFFAAQSYRDFFGFRFAGRDKGFTEVQFIRSSVIDTTLPPSQKNNFRVEVLSSKVFVRQPSSPIDVTINIRGFEAELVIDGASVLKAEAQRSLSDGQFGFSHTNNLLRISDVAAYRGQSIVFSDNFTAQSIKSNVVNATVENKQAE
jgi:hypothetical protein